MKDQAPYTTFAEFYPYYLGEHRNRTCRALHYVGSLLGLSIVCFALFSRQWLLIPAGLIAGYAFAWVGHFFFEHNKPATFQYPLYSLLGDWVMLKDALTGRLPSSD